MVANLDSETHWVCPNCTFTHVSFNDKPNYTQMHDCKGMKLMSMPMVRDGVRCKVEANEREDYIGGELVQTDAEGRPVMNAKVTRNDGDDCFVYAPTAKAGASA